MYIPVKRLFKQEKNVGLIAPVNVTSREEVSLQEGEGILIKDYEGTRI